MIRVKGLIGIAYSIKDPAGSGVAEYIIKEIKPRNTQICDGAETCLRGENFVLAGFREDVIYFDFLDYRILNDIDFYVVLSRHSSEAGVKSYTIHTTGNFSHEAPFGGRPRELGIAYPSVMWFLLRALHRLAIEHSRSEYEVSYESSHHGPTSLAKPITFVEIGSSVNEWIDKINYEILGDAILLLIKKYPSLPKCKPVIGIGGGHYPRKHTELALLEDICYGHIASKHVLSFLDEEMLRAMVSRTREYPEEIIIEKKSTRREQRELLESFSRTHNIGIRYV